MLMAELSQQWEEDFPFIIVKDGANLNLFGKNVASLLLQHTWKQIQKDYILQRLSWFLLLKKGRPLFYFWFLGGSQHLSWFINIINNSRHLLSSLSCVTKMTNIQYALNGLIHGKHLDQFLAHSKCSKAFLAIIIDHKSTVIYNLL